MKAKQVATGVRRFGVLALVPALIAGCASMTAQAPEDVVKARAAAYWKAKLAGEAESAYSFAAPSYRAVTDFDRFKQKYFGGTYVIAAEVINVECKEKASVCTARTRLDFNPPPVIVGGRPANLGGVQSTHRDERWIMEEGKWWRYFEPVQ